MDLFNLSIISFYVSNSNINIPTLINFCSNIDTSNENDLKLTSLVESEKIIEARASSSVHIRGFEDIESYSGFLTINKDLNTNLFFWYFVAEEKQESAPVILWLQGGPGYSSLYGILYENGPFEVKANRLKRRYHSWHKYYHMLYIDSPVGAGYSFTDGGYAENQTAVGEDLYRALVQFFKLFPDLQKNDFYITGQSYAGKFVPSISYTIHKKNPDAILKINLKGLAIGNGLISPIDQNKFSGFLYTTGLINDNQNTLLRRYEDRLHDYIIKEDWKNASKTNHDIYSAYGILSKITGYNSYYDILKEKFNYEYIDLDNFMLVPELQESLHVGHRDINSANKLRKNLNADITKSVNDTMRELLENYKIFVYNGNLDIVVGYQKTEEFLMNLPFAGCEEFRNAVRNKWIVDDQLAGYIKRGGNLTLYLVRNSGHCVPKDQPKLAMDIINKLTNNF